MNIEVEKPESTPSGRRNVIILTTGIAGSSVLTALLARAGYWCGDATFEKSDYNTYENTELIELNKEIIESARLQENYQRHYREHFITKVEQITPSIDGTRLTEFIDRCNGHRPWVWKDPRLWLTIRVWKHWLDFADLHFIHLRRDPKQAWISTTLRRQIQSRKYSDEYAAGIDESIRQFLKSERAESIEIWYEDLIDKPESELKRINQFLGTSMERRDLERVYRGELGASRKGIWSLIKAYLIYLKNYRYRYDIQQ